MKTNNNKSRFKVLASIALIAVMSLTFSCKKDKDEAVDTVNSELNIEKDDVLAQLNEVSKLYDLALEEKKGVSEELVAAKARIEGLIDSLKVADVNVKNIVKYRIRNEEMKSEMLTLLRDNEELVQNSKILVHSLNKRKAQLEEQKKLNQKLAVKNETLATVNEKLSTDIKTAAVLSIAKLNGIGLKERSSGKITETSKARRVDKIKVCYTVAENPLLEAGEKKLYIQVIDANDNVMGENELKKFDSKELYYSLESNFEYNNKTIDVCEYLPSDKFAKGNYFINVFNEDKLLSTSSLTLD